MLMNLGWVEASSPVLSIAGKEQSSRSQRMAGGMEIGDWRERREMTGWQTTGQAGLQVCKWE